MFVIVNDCVKNYPSMNVSNHSHLPVKLLVRGKMAPLSSIERMQCPFYATSETGYMTIRALMILCVDVVVSRETFSLPLFALLFSFHPL